MNMNLHVGHESLHLSLTRGACCDVRSPASLPPQPIPATDPAVGPTPLLEAAPMGICRRPESMAITVPDEPHPPQMSGIGSAPGDRLSARRRAPTLTARLVSMVAAAFVLPVSSIGLTATSLAFLSRMAERLRRGSGPGHLCAPVRSAAALRALVCLVCTTLPPTPPRERFLFSR